MLGRAPPALPTKVGHIIVDAQYFVALKATAESRFPRGQRQERTLQDPLCRCMGMRLRSLRDGPLSSPGQELPSRAGQLIYLASFVILQELWPVGVAPV